MDKARETTPTENHAATRTSEDRERLHREMWGWLAKNPDGQKRHWPEFSTIEPPQAYCFACEEGRICSCLDIGVTSSSACACCPLGVIDPYDGECLDGLFDRWNVGSGDRRGLAAEIRDLPWSNCKD